MLVFEHISENFIVGIDFIGANKRFYDPEDHTYHWGRPTKWNKGVLKLTQQGKLEPLSVTHVPMGVVTKSGTISRLEVHCIASMGHPTKPPLSGGPFLISGNKQGQTHAPSYNCSPTKVTLSRNDFVGIIENI